MEAGNDVMEGGSDVRRRVWVPAYAGMTCVEWE